MKPGIDTCTNCPVTISATSPTASIPIIPRARPAPASVSRWRIQGGRCATWRRYGSTATAMARLPLLDACLGVQVWGCVSGSVRPDTSCQAGPYHAQPDNLNADYVPLFCRVGAGLGALWGETEARSPPIIGERRRVIGRHLTRSTDLRVDS